MSGNKPPPLLIYGALLLMHVLFGINYVTSKVIVAAFPPLVWASARIVIASVLMLCFALALGRPFPKGGRAFFVPLILYALLGAVLNQAAFLVGLRHTTATNSAILNTLIPVFTLLIVTVRGQEPLTLRRGLGFAVAFAGVLAIRKIEDFSLSDKTLWGDLLTVGNCLSYGLFLSYSKKFMEQNDRVWITTWMFIYGSVGMGLLAAPDWLHFQGLPPMTPRLIGAMVFAILGGTLVTYFLNLWTLAQTRASSVAIFVYAQPVIAATLGWIWLGQPITPRVALCSVVIFAGVLIVLAPRRAPAVAVAAAKEAASG